MDKQRNIRLEVKECTNYVSEQEGVPSFLLFKVRVGPLMTVYVMNAKKDELIDAAAETALASVEQNMGSITEGCTIIVVDKGDEETKKYLYDTLNERK